MGATFIHRYLQERALHSLPYGFKKFSLSDPIPLCGRWKEHMPSKRDPVAYNLYIEARKVWRSKIGWQLTRAETTRILTDVGKAAELGDWGARALLARFYLYGLGVLESNHVLDAAPEKGVEIARMAAAEGQPWGVFDLGVAYEHGYGGAVHDPTLAWAYFLRAAELGSPEAQMALASAYGQAGRLADAEAMQQCAYKQGHGLAAYELGIKAELKTRYMDAIRLYQEGVKFGSKESAASLELLFKDGYSPGATDEEKVELRRLGIRADPERKSRYNVIYDALEINPDLRLGRLDEVLPLPPAKLPRWSNVNDAAEPESDGPPTY
ncbi:sel1 repeat family protein [Duganella sp. CY42W]|uniref:Sel1 repeat family protein n=1 Tax=Duganella levis TaxID=2692169 RepID=A0ABW9W4N8_9BURK|nr:sel1 repeat family protein [Duganella levis]